MDNNVTIVGNLTRDPELRESNSGTSVCTFTVAQAPRVKGPDGQFTDGEAMFFDVTAFRGLGENTAASLAKGRRVIVVGKLKQRSWQTPEGDKRSKVEVIADSVGPDLRFAGLVETPAPAYSDDEPF